MKESIKKARDKKRSLLRLYGEESRNMEEAMNNYDKMFNFSSLQISPSVNDKITKTSGKYNNSIFFAIL